MMQVGAQFIALSAICTVADDASGARIDLANGAYMTVHGSCREEVLNAFHASWVDTERARAAIRADILRDEDGA